MAMRNVILHNLGYWIFIGALTAASAFFTYNVQIFRSEIAAKRSSETLAAGVAVKVKTVIDGDEVQVTAPTGSVFTIRILGIKAFSPKVNEPGVSSYGQACMSSLETTILGKTVTVQFKEFKKDSRRRVLAYLSLGDLDVGRFLVERGLAMVYTRYAFDREKDYLIAQSAAMRANRGLWGSPRSAERARALKASWEAMRDDV